MEEIDPRSLPQTTIRKVIKECLDKGVFEDTPEINRRPLVDHVPWEIAKNYKPKMRKGHWKVKALGTYLSWSKVLLGGEEVHILNVYLEPGHEKFVVQRADKVIQLTKDIMRQDPSAKVIVGGDVNGMFSKVNTYLLLAGFKPALI